MFQRFKKYAIEVAQHGRSGSIRYSEGERRSYEFYWEFGGAQTVATISVPTPAEWPRSIPWAADRRAEILQRVADEVRRQRCRRCRAVIGDAWIEFVEPVP